MSLPPMPPSMKKMPPMPPSMKKALPMPPSMKQPAGAKTIPGQQPQLQPSVPQQQQQQQQSSYPSGSAAPHLPYPPSAGAGAGHAPPSHGYPPYAPSHQQHHQQHHHQQQSQPAYASAGAPPYGGRPFVPSHHQHQQGGGGPYAPAYPSGAGGAPSPLSSSSPASASAPGQPPLGGPGSSAPPGYGGGYHSMRGRGRGGGFYGSRGGGGGSFGEDRPLRDATNTVWAGNLDPAAHTDDVLRSAFSEFGVVMRIAKHMEHSYCFIHFRHVHEAQQAVNTLRERGTLGNARFNYGKMFEYTEEEMRPDYRPPDPSERAGGGGGGYGRRPREEGGEDGGDGRPPFRRKPDVPQMEPSNVLWVGSLPEYISDERLEEFFSVCGTVKFVSRMERGNMAFVHFTTVEECTLALETMKGKRIDGSVVLALNYGHPQRPKSTDPTAVSASGSSHGAGTSDGVNPNEVATNVVYLGMIPPNATDEDVESVFAPYEGFLFAKFVSSSGIAFGHFDTIDHSRVARVALQNTTICGVPIRVSFGKNNHNYTEKPDRTGAGAQVDLDALMRDPSASSSAGAGNGAMTVVTQLNGQQLVLPAMGSSNGGGDQQGSGMGNNMANFGKERAAPELNLRARLQSVMGSTYNGCGEAGNELTPTQIEAICFMVDQCVDEEHAAQLDTTLALYLPSKAVHVLNVMTKRIREFYTADPIRKLHVFYSATKMFLKSAQQAMGEEEGSHMDTNNSSAVDLKEVYTSAALNALLMLLLATSERQSRAGVDRLITIMDALERHTALLERYSNITETYKEEFRAQLKEIRVSAEAEQDLSSLLSSRRRRKAN